MKNPIVGVALIGILWVAGIRAYYFLVLLPAGTMDHACVAVSLQ